MKSLRFDFPLIQIERNPRIPLYRQVYDWFRDAILKGQLKPGQRLPSTRNLALDLSISRIPVVAAFEQLYAEGYVETILGSGTFVSKSIPDEIWAAKPNHLRNTTRGNGQRRISRVATDLLEMQKQSEWDGGGAFRVSQPALDLFPTKTWSRLLARHSKKSNLGLMEYSDPAGFMPLRESIVEYLGTVRGVRCKASQIMIVTGSQQGLQLAGRVLLNSGEQVWMEEPGYIGARQALYMAGASLVPVPVDAEGLDVGEGIRRCPAARLAYVTPSHQYPLGMKMSVSRRMLLLDWAAKNGSWIIEDDYDSEYRFASRPIASLQGLDADARVIYVGTFSKVLFPALRIGYLVIPQDLVAAFTAVRNATDIFSSTLYQRALKDFIDEGHFGRHVRKMRMLYMERRDVLADALRKRLSGSLEIAAGDGGMHLVGLLPRGVKDTALATRAAQNGVPVLPLSTCYLGAATRGGFVLGYAGSSVEDIRIGVRKLAMSLRGLSPYALH